MPVMRSPDEMYKKAKELMLEGREPETKTDYLNVALCWAVNLVDSVRDSALKLMCKMYDFPLDDDDLKEVLRRSRLESNKKGGRLR